MWQHEPGRPQPEAAQEEAAEGTASDLVDGLRTERDQYKAMAQRTQADFLNYKRRMEEERAVLVRNANSSLLSRLLSVVDDLQRAVQALPTDAPPSWGEGVGLVLQNMQALLQSEGVMGYGPEAGDMFDPAEHEAVYYQPSVEQPAGKVLTTVRRGYRTQDRILRPAQVVVAREPESYEQSAVGDTED